jgi:hypothetical protein
VALERREPQASRHLSKPLVSALSPGT